MEAVDQLWLQTWHEYRSICCARAGYCSKVCPWGGLAFNCI